MFVGGKREIVQIKGIVITQKCQKSININVNNLFYSFILRGDYSTIIICIVCLRIN